MLRFERIDEERAILAIQTIEKNLLAHIKIDNFNFLELKKIVHHINHLDDIYVCPYLVIKNRSMRLRSKIQKNKMFYETYKLFLDLLIPKLLAEKNEIIHQKTITQHLNLTSFTKGDLIREYLDLMICHGFLEKIRFKKGRGGHLFKINALIPTPPHCEYYDIEKGCLCSNYRILEKQEYETGVE